MHFAHELAMHINGDCRVWESCDRRDVGCA